MGVDLNLIRVHKFTVNKNAKMNQTVYETIINCIFVFIKEMVIPVNTDVHVHIYIYMCGCVRIACVCARPYF